MTKKTSAPTRDALASADITPGTPANGTPKLRERVIPEGWVALDAALAWVAFFTAAHIDDAAGYVGASDWPFCTPDALVSALRAVEPGAFKNLGRAGLNHGTYWSIWSAAKGSAQNPTADDLARACAHAADGLVANLPQARDHHAKLARAAHRLRRAIAIDGLSAYGWRADSDVEAETWIFIGSARERIPAELCAAPVTLVHDGIIPTIQGDLPEDGFARLWHSVVIDADDLLGRFPVPNDGAPAVAYRPTPSEGKQRGAGGHPVMHNWKLFQDEIMRRLYHDGGTMNREEFNQVMKKWAKSAMPKTPNGDTIVRKINELVPGELFPVKPRQN